MSRTIRGQAALEFLSTYGFAFLIILVMIGALSYFGVLSPTNLIPARCNFPADFNCFETQLVRDTAGGGNASINVVLINQISDQLTLNQGNATSQYGVGWCTFNPATIIGGARTIVTCNMQNSTTGVLNGANFPAKGQKVKVSLMLTYTELGRAYPVPVTGEILQTLS